MNNGILAMWPTRTGNPSTIKKTVPTCPKRGNDDLPSPLPRQWGFSLFELMIVIAIAGVLAAMAAPSMRNMLLNQKAKTAASDAHISFLLARSEAIKRGINIEIEKNTTWNNGWDVQVPGSTILKTQDPMPDLTVDDIPASTSNIAFTRAGRSNAPLELRFYVSGNNLVTMRCVSISLSGRPHVELDTNGNTADGCN